MNTEQETNNEIFEATDLRHLPEYLKTVPEGTRVYLGCDSERVKKQGIWYADYCTVVVVHKGGNNGCKIFGVIVRERDFDQKLDKPRMRLLGEVQKVAMFYLENFEMIEPFDPEIHLDINPNLEWGSSCVITEAVGYIKGMCGLTPRVKPEAFSASYAADRFAYIRSQHSKKRTRRAKRKADKKARKTASKGSR